MTIRKQAMPEPGGPMEQANDTPEKRAYRRAYAVMQDIERELENLRSKETDAMVAGDNGALRQVLADIAELTNALNKLRRAYDGPFGALEQAGEQSLAKHEAFARSRPDDVIDDSADEQLIKSDTALAKSIRDPLNLSGMGVQYPDLYE